MGGQTTTASGWQRLTPFKSVGHRLIAAIGLAVAIGIGGVILFHAYQQQSEIRAAHERTMRQIAESAQRGLETIMMGGYADVAPYYAERLKEMRDVDDFRILRMDGREAFLDNVTIDAINGRFGTEIFMRKSVEGVAQVLAPGGEVLRRAAAGETVSYTLTDEAGDSHVTLVSPILMAEACHSCHGRDDAVKGVIKITMSLAEVEADLRRSWFQAVAVLLGSAPLVMLLGWAVARRWIVQPIETVSAAMARVADGRLDQTVPIPAKDELGEMAVSFNSMVDQLLRTYDGLQNEQNKLTTIIQAAIEGIVVSDDRGTIVLANPAAERLLGRPIWALMGSDFADLVNDRAHMAEWLADGAAAADIAYDGRILNVQIARIAGEAGEVLGSSALLRDVTEERVLEQRLRSLATTDALTGLWNRRHLDQTLAAEFDRARRYGLQLSVLLFDVDHFKRFNDTHGHAVGDRVLQVVAQQVAACVRQVDVACRYGGEEFVVLLPGTDLAGGLGMAERLRARIAATSLDGLSVTVTIGVAALPDLDVANPAQLLEAADRALYEGKRAGRDRVVAATPSATEA